MARTTFTTPANGQPTDASHVTQFIVPLNGLEDFRDLLTSAGDLITHDGVEPKRLPAGLVGQVLTAQADGSVAWQTVPAPAGMQVDQFSVPLLDHSNNLNLISVSGNWDGRTADGDLTLHRVTPYNLSNTNGDTIRKNNMNVPVSGNWYMRFAISSEPSGGKVDIYVDTTVVATVDTYKGDSPTSRNDWHTVSLGTLTAGTKWTLKFTVNGKNASSTGYLCVITSDLYFYRVT